MRPSVTHFGPFPRPTRDQKLTLEGFALVILSGVGWDMDVVAALVCDTTTRAHLRRSLAGVGRVEFCCRVAELPEIVLRHRARVIITDLWDVTGTPTAPAVRRLHSHHSAIPILAYCAPGPRTSGELLAMVHAGISGIVFREVDDPGRVIRSALECAEDRRLAETVTGAIGPLVPTQGRTFIAYCIEHARTAPTVAEVASSIGVHRKTLVNWMLQAGLPTPRAVTAWSRILLATWLLGAAERSVESVALDLGFGSASELRNMLRRYTGMRPAELRGPGGFPRVLELFIHQRRADIAHREPLVSHPRTV
jgi:AraC-like DNA-binding protein